MRPLVPFTVLGVMLPKVDRNPASLLKMWEEASRITDSPRWVWERTDTRLAMVALKTSRAASLPKSSAAFSSRARTVGSSR
jgi:hypothetical protein